jgi:hypothetical protein
MLLSYVVANFRGVMLATLSSDCDLKTLIGDFCLL